MRADGSLCALFVALTFQSFAVDLETLVVVHHLWTSHLICWTSILSFALGLCRSHRTNPGCYDYLNANRLNHTHALVHLRRRRPSIPSTMVAQRKATHRDSELSRRASRYWIESHHTAECSHALKRNGSGSFYAQHFIHTGETTRSARLKDVAMLTEERRSQERAPSAGPEVDLSYRAFLYVYAL
ncbi:hypothetical protein BD414DRAFT_204669 [Trametes punicea]|nr:hypothetical protein BD414DRAFT_204669 [Trametes punicea]